MKKFKTLKHIAENLVTVRKYWLKLSVLMMIYVIFMASSPYFYKILLDWLETNLRSNSINLDFIWIILIWVWVIFWTIWSRYIYGMFVLRCTQFDWWNFMLKSIRMMMRLPIDYHISTQHGEKQKIIDRASEAVWEFWDSGMIHIVPQLLISLILIVWGLFIDVRMTLISLILLPFSILWIWYIGNTAHGNQREANKYWDALHNRIVDAFTNLKIVRIFSREKHETEIIDTKLKFARDFQHKIRKTWLVFYGIGGFITTLWQAVTLTGGIYFMLRWEISFWTLFFFISFTDRIYGPIFTIFQKLQEIFILIAKYEKMQVLFDTIPESDHGVELFKGIKKSLIFENVRFTYPSTNREVLKWVHIEVKKWEKIALIGHTGSGKSTIVQLLMRFYDYTYGSIKVDGKKIDSFSLESYRQRFASVFQDTTLFNESIRHNLEYVRDGITEKDLKKACKEANILDFIESLPDTWNTEVGERGLKLSGGEKQRIAIARAILADPDILILDEATSALDTETERLIQDSLEKLMEGRTSIIIAHRLSTIQHVDRIYMLDDGEVVAHGSHTELLKSSEKYRHLIALQHDGFVWEEEMLENPEIWLS